MKLHSPLPHKKTRIEIIPLIDIMFFLLACFMLVSLNMIQLHGLNVNLPIASSTSSTPDDTKKPVTITVDKLGTLLVDKDTIPREALAGKLEQLKKDKGDELRIYIAGDKEASHGDVVSILDQVRNAGISKVAIQIKAGSPGSTSTSHIPAAASSSRATPAGNAPAPAQPSAQPSAPAGEPSAASSPAPAAAPSPAPAA
ncbi:MAG: biopolymer transporter ExbD, partial [Candidatus Methylacidiphilales bacterium]